MSARSVTLLKLLLTKVTLSILYKLFWKIFVITEKALGSEELLLLLEAPNLLFPLVGSNSVSICPFLATGSHMRPSSPSQASSAEWSGLDSGRAYASISSAPVENHARRMQISANTYIPPSSGSASTLPSPTSPTSKPPLPIGSRRAYTANSGL